MASSSSIAKVLDFGISKIRGSQTVKTQDALAARHAAVHGARAGDRQALRQSTSAPTCSRSARSSTRCCGAARRSRARRSRGRVQGGLRAAAAARGELEPTLPRTSSTRSSRRWPRSQRAFHGRGGVHHALTGRPLQTLDRARAKNPAPEAFASTQRGDAGVAAAAGRGDDGRAAKWRRRFRRRRGRRRSRGAAPSSR